MAEGSFQEKTEQPTDKRLQDARKKGQVAQSRELAGCLMILSTATLFYFCISQGFDSMFRVYANYARNLNVEVNMNNIFDILSFGSTRALLIMLPVFILLVTVAVFAGVIQTGFMWSLEALKFSGENINPISGLKKLMSKKSVIELIKSAAKIGVLGYIAYSLIIREMPAILSLADRDIGSIVAYVGRTALTFALKVGFVFLFIAGLDYAVQRWQFRKDMMMTLQEVKEEFKEREGNPLVKSRIRSLQRDMARHRMMEDVKKADVVITNPTTFAIALSYQISQMPAPRIMGKGAGFMAEKIKQVARKNSIPLVENKPLARALFYSVKVGDYVPEKFYVIVAELLAEVYRKRQRVVF